MRTPRQLLLALLIPVMIAACGGRSGEEPVSFDIAVFLPGRLVDHPAFLQLTEGVRSAARKEKGTRVRVFEGGYFRNQWPEGMIALAESGSYTLIVTAGPEMAEISAELSRSYPDQRFLVLDGYVRGNRSIHSVFFNRMEQSFLAGTFSGLATTRELSRSNPDLRVGMIAGELLPGQGDLIRLGFELGLRNIDPAIQLEVAEIGNWFDAARAQALAEKMYAGGIDVILAFAGAANRGIVEAARRMDGYVVWFDAPGYVEAPGTVIGSSVIRMDRLAEERTAAAIRGELEFGRAELLGVEEGYVDFASDDRRYRRYVPAEVREAQQQYIQRMRSGELYLNLPDTFQLNR